MTRWSLFLFSFLLAGAASAVPTSGIEGFTEIEPYPSDSKEFSCANMSHDEWEVRIESKKVLIAPAKHRNTATLEMAGGTFTGKDGGEWEGNLVYNEGKESQTLFKENISALFSVSKSTVIAFGGLAHLGTDEGYMLIISKLPKVFGWKVEKKVKLPGNPYAVATNGPDSFYFVTGEGLFSIQWKTEKIEKLKASHMTGIYPNSLVISDDKHVYVGMRHAVAHFIPGTHGYDVKWLVKTPCLAK